MSAALRAEAIPEKSARTSPGGWGRYLLLTAALAPVLVPMGPGQTAIIDPINAIAIVLFFVLALGRGAPIRIPFLLPAFLITIGSLVATFNAVSPGASWLTLAQDAYLYSWFVMLVNVMQGRRELRQFRIAWVIVADVIAILGIVLVMIHGHASLWALIGPKGLRATGSFTNTNELASYLVLSLFVLLSLERDTGRLFRWGSLAVLGMGLLATKSNAGMVSLTAGLAVWAPLRSWTRHRSPAKLAAVVTLATAGILAIWWSYSAWGLGSSEIRGLQRESSLGRAAHSSEERSLIWSQLLSRWTKTPLGIGPGNSKWQPLSVSERERKTSYYSKEAHNDALAYLVERGPLGLLGLLLLLGQVVVLFVAWLKLPEPGGGATGSGGSLPAAMAGALVAWVFFSFTHETLHSRHYILFLAMACALAMRAVQQGSRVSLLGEDRSPRTVARSRWSAVRPAP